jgi:hypothetical protein
MWSVLLLGGWSALRAAALLHQNNLLQEQAISPNLTVQIAMAAVWAVVFVGLAGAIWRKRPFTRYTTPLALLLYGATELTILNLYAHPLTQWQNWPTNSLFYISITLFTAWGLNRSRSHHYYD